ncbi:hypothetical protein [uncultured Shewanella sp.]|uniref:hypothetical protein n=1 Tax=uncultured Shewanella sp. TaxID=173975 RepID=UPI002605D97E|nr:hypothetical protein [uncultured Shewanella sp.]
MNKIQSVSLMSLFVLALPLSVYAKAPLEGEPDWEARKLPPVESEANKTEKERLLQELKRLEEAEEDAQKRLDNRV